MPKTHVAAIDLGATSGRVIVGSLSSAGLELNEVHRFPNAFRRLGDHDYWDVGSLFHEVVEGLRKAHQLFPDLLSCGIDTWGVDHVLVNESGRIVTPVHAYRDERTRSILARIESGTDARRLFDWTGQPPINYNSGLQH